MPVDAPYNRDGVEIYEGAREAVEALPEIDPEKTEPVTIKFFLEQYGDLFD